MAGTTTVILPRTGLRTSRASSPIQKIPVAAYARVSTEKEEQEDSFPVQ